MSTALAPLAALLLAAGCSPAAELAGQHAESLAKRDSRENCEAQASATSPEVAAQVALMVDERPDWIVDKAGILSAAVERKLAKRARSLEVATTDQIVVVTVAELGGLSIEQFASALANSWGIGRADMDNGVLVLVAPRERRVRIAVGCGLEEVLTDARTAQIVDLMLPLLMKSEFDGAVLAGTGAVESTLRAKPERQRAG